MPRTIGFEHIDPSAVILIDGHSRAVTPVTERAAAIGAMLTAMGGDAAARAVDQARGEAAYAARRAGHVGLQG